MGVLSLLLRIIIFHLITINQLSESSSCNVSVCGSVVSKCLLNKDCECKVPGECHSLTKCKKCLDKHYTECCPCVSMCPTETARNVTESEISEFHGSPAIFDVVAKMLDNSFHTTYSNGELISADEMIEFEESNHEDKTCTVLFINTCMSNKKCEAACEEMGAQSSRWFLDGCCECIGHSCIPSGINESKCTACPEKNEIMENGFDYDNFDLEDLQFGEGTEVMSVKSDVGELPESPVNLTSFVDYDDKMLTIHEIPVGKQSSAKCYMLYINDCMTLSNCARKCERMGATSYRMFADGCCECVGSMCPLYGVNESKCDFNRKSCDIENNTNKDYMYESNGEEDYDYSHF